MIRVLTGLLIAIIGLATAGFGLLGIGLAWMFLTPGENGVVTEMSRGMGWFIGFFGADFFLIGVYWFFKGWLRVPSFLEWWIGRNLQRHAAGDRRVAKGSAASRRPELFEKSQGKPPTGRDRRDPPLQKPDPRKAKMNPSAIGYPPLKRG